MIQGSFSIAYLQFKLEVLAEGFKWIDLKIKCKLVFIIMQMKYLKNIFFRQKDSLFFRKSNYAWKLLK